MCFFSPTLVYPPLPPLQPPRDHQGPGQGGHPVAASRRTSLLRRVSEEVSIFVNVGAKGASQAHGPVSTDFAATAVSPIVILQAFGAEGG